MEKEEFLTVSREFFKNMGFQTLKKSKFYYETNELVLQVYMDRSNFGEIYYIDYLISIKSLHTDENYTNYANFESCIDAQGRFGVDNYQIEVDYRRISAEQYIGLLAEQSQIHVCPILQRGLKGLLMIPRLFIYKQQAKDYFKNLGYRCNLKY